MENVPQSRRSFLTSLALLLGSAGLLWRYLTPHIPPFRQVLARVPASDIPANGALVYRDARLAVIRDNNKIYALSMICTHLGCTLNVSDKELTCPCHGSRFDRYGNVLQGPADKPLKQLKVEQRDNMVEVLAS